MNKPDEIFRIRRFVYSRLRQWQLRTIRDDAVNAGILTRHKLAEPESGSLTAYAVSPHLLAFPESRRSIMIARALNKVRQGRRESSDEYGGMSQASGRTMTSPRDLVWLGDQRNIKIVLSLHIPSIPVAELVLAELICAAVESSLAVSGQILRRLRSNDCRILLNLPVRGVLSTLLRMTGDGLLSARTGSLRSEPGWSRDANTLLRFGAKSIRILDLSESDDFEDALLKSERSIYDGENIVFLASVTNNLPSWVSDTADITLQLQDFPLDALANVIQRTTQAAPDYCQTLLSKASLSLQSLYLADFSRAIRENRTPVEIISRLMRMSQFRRTERTDKATRPLSSGSGRRGTQYNLEILQPAKDNGDSAADHTVKVEDLSGIGVAADWASGLKADLALWQKGLLQWTDLSAKALVYGPPGTGKTNFARALRNTLALPLIVSSVGNWLEPGYLGDVLQRMSQTFAKACEIGPCILFIDEIDGIGTRDAGHGRAHDDYWISIVNRMLTLLDGAVKSEGVVILGATNRFAKIDPALLRSGRLERHMEIALPNIQELEGIFRYHLGKDCEALELPKGLEPLSATQSPSNVVRRLAARSLGYSGADVAQIVKSARTAARRRGTALCLNDLEAELSSRAPENSPELNKQTALHEAGHAVAYTALRVGTVMEVAISAKGGGRTRVNLDNNSVQSEAGIMAQIAALLAGREAELAFCGSALAGSGGHDDSDLARATGIAIQLESTLGYGSDAPLLYKAHLSDPSALYLADGHTRTRINARLESAAELAKQIIANNRRVVETLSEALLTKFEMKGEQLKLLLMDVQRTASSVRHLKV